MIRLLQGDCREVLASLPAESVQCCVTSPPYLGLRDYGVAGQIGLEQTPAEYVEQMVAVFREVRRVLRSDGTCWVNLGDAYANDGKWGGSTEGYRVKRQTGLKPKDLMGIPWRVAQALQAPFYTGRIRDERDRIWLAAMIDAEGCMFVHRRKAGQHNGQGYYRQQDSFGPGLEVANTSEAIVRRCLEITGLGSICSQSPDQNNRRKQTIFRWNLRTIECRDVVREIYPYLVAKQHQARLLCGCPSSGSLAAAAHEGLIALHNGSETTADFPPPLSMFEPGYYLRSDIIWAKKNCMPESVTDRPPKAHEYLFLFAKSERYFYDGDVIRERRTSDEDAATFRGGCYTGGEVDNGTLGKRAVVGNKRVKVPGGWDRGDGGHGTIHRSGRTSAEYQEAELKSGRNARSVWTIATQPFSEAHFATFPPELARSCILAGTRPGDTVLDPFAGAGTALLVADREQRDAIGIELNPAYVEIARRRISGDAPLLAEVT